MAPERRWAARAFAVALAMGAAALVVLGVIRAQAPPEGPEPVVWDRTSCARCRMLIGEPGFAAQLQLRDGRVLFFDDPGCLLLYADETAPDPHAAYFHHLEEDRWIPRDAVGFVRAEPSPMGYGLGAVDRNRAELSPEEALAIARTRDAARSGG